MRVICKHCGAEIAKDAFHNWVSIDSTSPGICEVRFLKEMKHSHEKK